MKFSLAAAASALPSVATASIVSIKVPETIAVGESFEVQLINNIDQSSTYETAITFGLGTTPRDSSLVIGSPVSSIYLQDKPIPAAPFTRNMTLSSGSKGETGIRAVVFGVYGITGGYGTKVYGANVTIGDETSDKYVELEYVYQESQ